MSILFVLRLRNICRCIFPRTGHQSNNMECFPCIALSYYNLLQLHDYKDKEDDKKRIMYSLKSEDYNKLVKCYLITKHNIIYSNI